MPTETTPLFPALTGAPRLALFLGQLRQSLRLVGGSVILCAIGLYFISPVLIQGLQLHLDQKLAFFAVAEPFMAHVKFSFLTALFVMMPAILHTLWKAAAQPFGITEQAIGWFVLSTCVLFYSGASFCYFITLPYGIKFLLGFQSEQLTAVISISRFVTFVTVFILAFGIIFELPILMVFCAKSGLCPRRTFERQRRYAVLVIAIVAALLTPTPDIVNMLLMAVPLYLLYELGIVILKAMRL